MSGRNPSSDRPNLDGKGHDQPAADPRSPRDQGPRPADPPASTDPVASMIEAFFAPPPASLAGDEPSWRRAVRRNDSLDWILSRQSLLRSKTSDGPRTLRLPDLGEEVFGFRLVRRLGQGAFAGVFLAEQVHLAARPVVVKISAITGDEAQTLAQLRHPSIVPIHSVHEDSLRGLRAVCMPYLGGASLSEVLRQLYSRTPSPKQGAELIAALDSLSGEGTAAGTEEITPASPVASLDYYRAVAWLISRLALGLQHAHDRNVLHLDVKPSNVLLAADGQPLLLDFNLSRDARTEAPAAIGGTVAYMAPEHLRALASHSLASSRLVDHRCDIYSLGLVLFEMLTGQRPFQQIGSYSVFPALIEAMALERSQGVPSLGKRHAIPPDLAAIIERCLQPDPAQRYQKAAHLADDLGRFVTDRPLCHVAERSRTERARKWLRRHPRLSAAGLMALVLLLLLVPVAIQAYTQSRGREAAEDQIRHRDAFDRKAQFEEGIQEARCLVNTVVDYQDTVGRGEEVCTRTLQLYGLLEDDHFAGSAWKKLHPDWKRLPKRQQGEVAEGARELFLLLAMARVELQWPTRKEAALREALVLLDRADALPGLSRLRGVELYRAYCLEYLSKREAAKEAQERADRLSPKTAHEHYLHALSLARTRGAGHLSALDALTRGLKRDPRHYWSLIQRGLGHVARDEIALAAADFAQAAGVRADLPLAYFNLGCAWHQGGRHQEAVQQYSAALERDPRFASAYLNRATAYLELNDSERAVRDYQKALRFGVDEAIVQTGRAITLERLGRQTEADEARAAALRLAGRLPAVVQARLHWSYGFAVCERSRERAETAFHEAIRLQPRQPKALYGLAALAMRANDLPEARRRFEQALQGDPQFVLARSYYAIVLARLGLADEARQEMRRCLSQDDKGQRILYAAACVAALTRRPSDLHGESEVFDLLEQAARAGFPMRGVMNDPDLTSLRNHPRLRRLAATAEAGAPPQGKSG